MIPKGYKFQKPRNPSNATTLIAPGGQRVRVYTDGYTQFLGEWTHEQKEIMHDAMQTAANALKIFDPVELYQKAGWVIERKKF